MKIVKCEEAVQKVLCCTDQLYTGADPHVGRNVDEGRRCKHTNIAGSVLLHVSILFVRCCS
jgi:hypothetical protein